MKRAILYGALGGTFAGPVMGVGAYVFCDDSWIRSGREALNLSLYVESLLVLPFALLGALLGGFCAHAVFFGCREMSRFSACWERGFQKHRLPILWLFPTGAVAAVLLAGGVPVSPGVYPLLENASGWARPSAQPEGQLHAIEVLQMRALVGREDQITQRFQRFFTQGFFAFQNQIQTVALLVLGATIAGWCAIVCATFSVSRRAGSEGVFWSLWLLAGGYFLGIACIGGAVLPRAVLRDSTHSPGERRPYVRASTRLPSSSSAAIAPCRSAASTVPPA